MTTALFMILSVASLEASAEPNLAQLGAHDESSTAGPWLAFPARPLAAVEDDSDAKQDPTSTEQPGEEPADETTKTAAKTATPWVEDANTDYRFLGLRARVIYIPKFMFGLFQADGGASVLAPSIGPEYVTRRNGFEVDTWLTYSSFGMDDAPFKSKSDPDVAYEIVRSELKTVTIGADFLWTKPLNDKGLSLMYGGGAGIGFVFGNLYRNQSYPPSGQPGDPEDYVKCPSVGAGPGDYCDDDNDHYGDYTEPSWFDGGSRPVLFPWIALPQVGLRWKPSKQFVLRVDTGLSFPGPFFFGVSGQYGLL